jgi:hypothetical protein
MVKKNVARRSDPELVDIVDKAIQAAIRFTETSSAISDDDYLAFVGSFLEFGRGILYSGEDPREGFANFEETLQRLASVLPKGEPTKISESRADDIRQLRKMLANWRSREIPHIVN